MLLLQSSLALGFLVGQQAFEGLGFETQQSWVLRCALAA
jgi:hypothetical protein